VKPNRLKKAEFQKEEVDAKFALKIKEFIPTELIRDAGCTISQPLFCAAEAAATRFLFLKGTRAF